MTTVRDNKNLRTVRATWLAEKMDINYAKANAMVHKFRGLTRAESTEVNSIIKKEARAPLYLKNKTLGAKKAWYKK